MGAGDAESYVDCRRLVDTNQDGRINETDTCVPGGGFINALRPVKLAMPLIEAARQGLAYQGRGSQSGSSQTPGPAPTGRARIFNPQFSTGVSESDQPTSLVTSLPSGSRSLYLFFDYENMVDGTPWEVRVDLDGQELSDTGLQSQPWAGGPAGNWWVGWSDADFADGAYTFRVLVNNQPLAEAEIQIGGRQQAAPSFSNIVFSQQTDSRGDPVEPTRLFPAGVKQFYVFFDYENMANGTEWSSTWYYNNEVVSTETERWAEGRSGRYTIEINSSQGLDEGNWRLELAIQGQPATRGDFVVSGQQGGVTFGPMTFASGMDNETGQPIDPQTSFPSGIERFFIFSDYSGMKDGLNCISRVYLNGQLVIDNPFVWGDESLFWSGDSGTWWNVVYANGQALPDGEYTQEMIVEGQVVQSGTVVVGAGGGAAPAPTPTPTASADSIQVQGVISDANTGRPIPGAFFLVLQPGIKIADFQWIDAEVYTMAEADRQGAFSLPLPLIRGQCYGLIVGAEGYQPVTQDDTCIGQDDDAETSLTIQLQRR
jgi:hypothetical protein